MSLYDYQQAFGAWDKTGSEMRKAIARWFRLYYGTPEESGLDTSQRIAYTVVNKLCRSVFAEYAAGNGTPFGEQILQQLDPVRREAVQLALVGGESYIKPCPAGQGFTFALLPRDRVLVFARDALGVPTDVGTMEQSTLGNYYYTLLERRQVDEKGFLTIENKLFRSLSRSELGQPAELSEHPAYQDFLPKFTYEYPVKSIGLARVCTPMVNCVDGSREPVSVYAAAEGLIRNIDRNEALLCGEFERGQSRIIASKDLLNGTMGLTDNLFVGLDQDPEDLGIQIFSPTLREQSFLARKQEYLRNVESVIGLKRGLLSDSNLEERTATEISSSVGEHNLTVMDFQAMWEKSLNETLQLCASLAQIYGMEVQLPQPRVTVDWGNGVLFDEEKTWADYKDMVASGLMAPEVALGWRFNLPSQTPQQRQVIREKYMPEERKENGT